MALSLPLLSHRTALPLLLPKALSFGPNKTCLHANTTSLLPNRGLGESPLLYVLFPHLQTRADTQLRVPGGAHKCPRTFPFLSRYSQLFLTWSAEMTQIGETSIPRLHTFHYLGQQSESVGNTHADKPKFLFALECTSDRKLFPTYSSNLHFLSRF